MNHRHVPHEALEMIDYIYGAAYGDASWAEFLECARAMLPNAQAVLFYHDKASRNGAVSQAAGADPLMVEKYNAGYSEINPWMNHATDRLLGKVVQADEMLPRREFVRTQYYREYLGPQNIETGIGVTLRREAGANYLFSVICADAEQESIENARAAVQAVVPHLGRAFDLYRAGSIAAASGKAKGLLRVGQNMVVVDADDCALGIIEESGVLSINGQRRLQCRDVSLVEAIEEAISSLSAASPVTAGPVFLDRPGRLPLRVSIYRPGGPGIPFCGGSECVLHIEDTEEPLPSAIVAYCNKHCLSIAETAVVTGLAHARSLEEIALERGTSVHTVRTQLKGIYSKTGVHRQADLIRQISAMAGASLGLPRS